MPAPCCRRLKRGVEGEAARGDGPVAELYTQRRTQRIGRHVIAPEVVVALLRIADLLEQAGNDHHAEGGPLVLEIGPTRSTQRKAHRKMLELVGIIVDEGGDADQRGRGQGEGGEAGAQGRSSMRRVTPGSGEGIQAASAACCTARRRKSLLRFMRVIWVCCN